MDYGDRTDRDGGRTIAAMMLMPARTQCVPPVSVPNLTARRESLQRASGRSQLDKCDVRLTFAAPRNACAAQEGGAGRNSATRPTEYFRVMPIQHEGL